MVLISVLVFLVLRQVMPIAAGLAGGVSLNSFGLASRGLGWGMRTVGNFATPALAAASPYVVRHVGNAARGAGAAIRNAAIHSGRNAYRAAGSGIEVLGRHWRNILFAGRPVVPRKDLDHAHYRLSRSTALRLFHAGGSL